MGTKMISTFELNSISLCWIIFHTATRRKTSTDTSNFKFFASTFQLPNFCRTLLACDYFLPPSIVIYLLKSYARWIRAPKNKIIVKYRSMCATLNRPVHHTELWTNACNRSSKHLNLNNDQQFWIFNNYYTIIEKLHFNLKILNEIRQNKLNKPLSRFDKVTSRFSMVKRFRFLNLAK